MGRTRVREKAAPNLSGRDHNNNRPFLPPSFSSKRRWEGGCEGGSGGGRITRSTSLPLLSPISASPPLFSHPISRISIPNKPFSPLLFLPQLLPSCSTWA